MSNEFKTPEHTYPYTDDYVHTHAQTGYEAIPQHKAEGELALTVVSEWRTCSITQGDPGVGLRLGLGFGGTIMHIHMHKHRHTNKHKRTLHAAYMYCWGTLLGGAH